MRLSIFAGAVCLDQRRLQGRKRETNLAVVEALEERSHADEANVVIPHDCVVGLAVAIGEFEVVVEDWFS